MSLLAIDTSTERMGVALVDEQRLLASYELLAQRPHAIELPEAVTRVLRAAGQSLEQLEAIAVDIGPGSFTGLRIGVAFVKALAFARRTPVVGVPSLDVLAANCLYAQSIVCPLVDAKQRKVYAACYRPADGHPRKQTDYALVGMDELLAMLPQDGPMLFVGDGVGLYGKTLTERLGDRALFAPPALWYPAAGLLGHLALDRLGQGQRDDPSSLVPMYLYPRDCTIRPAAS